MGNVNEFKNIRIFFSKKGDAKYISHLDLTRCMQRCIKRSGIPIWYTQGFHPHQYMTFALPLALGYESECESMDIRLTEPMDFQEVKERLNDALPRDIRVHKVADQQMDPKEISFADYEIQVAFSCGDVLTKFEKLMAMETVNVEKRTKKGIKEVDLKPLIQVISTEEENDQLLLKLRLPAGNTLNINPTLLFEAFCKAYHCEVEAYHILRTGIFTGNLAEFC